jgi:valyl-tRNA synthetase
MLAGLAGTVESATKAFDEYDYARALEYAEKSFWNWTDDYVELIKSRAYGEGPGAESAHAALQLALSVYLRLFAPFLPFVTEEVWSWWKEGSVHLTSWPEVEELEGVTGDPGVLEVTSDVLTAVRRVKSDAKVSMRAELEPIRVSLAADQIEQLRMSESDLKAAAGTASIDYLEGEFEVDARILQDSST